MFFVHEIVFSNFFFFTHKKRGSIRVLGKLVFLRAVVVGAVQCSRCLSRESRRSSDRGPLLFTHIS